jgi:hypothetical protein
LFGCLFLKEPLFTAVTGWLPTRFECSGATKSNWLSETDRAHSTHIAEVLLCHAEKNFFQFVTFYRSVAECRQCIKKRHDFLKEIARSGIFTAELSEKDA